MAGIPKNKNLPKNFEDFQPKYYTAQDVVCDKKLTPTQQTTELVKHHSMALFGLAVDLANVLDENQRLRKRLAQAKKQIDGLLNGSTFQEIKNKSIETGKRQKYYWIYKCNELEKQVAELQARIKELTKNGE